MQLYIDKYPNEIVHKMKKKFPDLIKNNETKYSSNFSDNLKLKNMKSRIDKMFDS